MILKKDNFRLGMALGLLLPLISLVLYYFAKFYPLYTIDEMLGAFKTNKSLVRAISITCLFLNVVLFTIYINTRKDKTAKGIFVITIIYAISSLIFNYFG
ncbi:MAG: hypothetical protein IT249_13145 [Chitinophagaceae bacterium]|nr:hypothetical protein [Chitinophagaceae bacterium]